MTRLLERTAISGIKIETCILPVTFSKAFENLKIEMDRLRPDVVICLGLAGNRQAIELEKVAINLIHCDLPDNEGVFQLDKLICPTGPVAFFSSLPVKEMSETKTDFPVRVSFSAGAYVCNYLMYKVLEYSEGKDIRAGFIHLPHLGENRDVIFKSLVEIIKVL